MIGVLNLASGYNVGIPITVEVNHHGFCFIGAFGIVECHNKTSLLDSIFGNCLLNNSRCSCTLNMFTFKPCNVTNILKRVGQYHIKFGKTGSSHFFGSDKYFLSLALQAVKPV